MPPAISCFCLTFARPQRILEEAVHSFLQQDYEGEKELLLLNDFAGQTIRFEHPEVTVINLPARFRSVGEKRNAAVALCRHDLLAVWDDDDIYLPHRLTFSASHYSPEKRFFKPSEAFVLHDGAVQGPRRLRFHGGSMWHRSLFVEAGGYPPIGSGEDDGLERKFEQIAGKLETYQPASPAEIFYLYRWGGTGSYHLSSFGRDRPGHSGNEKVLEHVTRQLRAGEIAADEVRLQPQWHADYARMVAEYRANQSAARVPPQT